MICSKTSSWSRRRCRSRSTWSRARSRSTRDRRRKRICSGSWSTLLRFGCTHPRDGSSKRRGDRPTIELLVHPAPSGCYAALAPRSRHLSADRQKSRRLANHRKIELPRLIAEQAMVAGLLRLGGFEPAFHSRSATMRSSSARRRKTGSVSSRCRPIHRCSAGAPLVRSPVNKRICFRPRLCAEQLRQPGDVRRDPPRWRSGRCASPFSLRGSFTPSTERCHSQLIFLRLG